MSESCSDKGAAHCFDQVHGPEACKCFQMSVESGVLAGGYRAMTGSVTDQQEVGLPLLGQTDRGALVVGKGGCPKVHQVPAPVVQAAQHVPSVQVLVDHGWALHVHVAQR